MSIACAVLGTGLGVARDAHRPARTPCAPRRARAAARHPVVRRRVRAAGRVRAERSHRRLRRASRPPPRIEGFWGALTVLMLLSYPVRVPPRGRPASAPCRASLEESGRVARSLARRGVPNGRAPAGVGLRSRRARCWCSSTCVSEFGAVSLMRYDTLTLRIESTRLLDRTTSITLSLLLAVVAFVVVVGGAARRSPAGAGSRPSGAGRRAHCRSRSGAGRCRRCLRGRRRRGRRAASRRSPCSCGGRARGLAGKRRVAGPSSRRRPRCARPR